MNVVALVFAGVIMFVLIFFGIGASQSLINGANISESDEMYSDYQTSKSIATQTFGFMGYIPYLVFITALFGVLVLLMKLGR